MSMNAIDVSNAQYQSLKEKVESAKGMRDLFFVTRDVCKCGERDLLQVICDRFTDFPTANSDRMIDYIEFSRISGCEKPKKGPSPFLRELVKMAGEGKITDGHGGHSALLERFEGSYGGYPNDFVRTEIAIDWITCTKDTEEKINTLKFVEGIYVKEVKSMKMLLKYLAKNEVDSEFLYAVATHPMSTKKTRKTAFDRIPQRR